MGVDINKLLERIDSADEDTLEHYGVLGMRWGVRKDRSTGRKVGKPVKGTKAATRSTPSVSKKGKRDYTPSSDQKSVDKVKKKDPREMSNDDIKKANERARLVREYRQLHTGQNSKALAIAKKISRPAARMAIKGASMAARSKGNESVAKFLDEWGGMTLDVLMAGLQDGRKKK